MLTTKNITIAIFLFLTLSASIKTGYGETLAASERIISTIESLDTPISFGRVDFDDGLPQLTVRAITQDQEGFVWIGTDGGLARYDGASTKVYKHLENEESSLSSSFITSLAIGPKGELWVGTTEGLNKFIAGSNSFERFLPETAILEIIRLGSGSLWVNTGEKIYEMQPEDASFRILEEISEMDITAIDECDSGELWIGTEYDGILRIVIDQGNIEINQKEYEELPDDSISSILCDSSSNLWVGTSGAGLYEINGKTEEVVSYDYAEGDQKKLSSGRITSLLEDANKNLWVGTMVGLNRISRKDGRIYQYSGDSHTSFKLAHQQIRSIYEDRGGVVWFGTQAGGVSTVDPLRIAFAMYHITGDTILSFSGTEENLWLGAGDGGGLLRYEDATGKLTRYSQLVDSEIDSPISLSDHSIWHVSTDEQGYVWIGTEGSGLIAFDVKAKTARHYLSDDESQDSLPNDTVFDILHDSDRAIWLATGAGLALYDKEGDTFQQWTPDQYPELGSGIIFDVYADRFDKNILWLGMGGAGLVQFNKTSNAFKSFAGDNNNGTSKNDESITSIYQESKNVLWLGTYGSGLKRIDTQTGESSHVLENFETIYGILSDQEGNIWFSTNGDGLVQYKPLTNDFIQYTHGDGLQSDEFALRAYYKLPNGKLVFGGGSGFNIFDPMSIKPDSYVPPVVISDIRVQYEPISSQKAPWEIEQIDLSYKENEFSFQFAALSYASSSQNKYKFMLEGFDENWVEVDRKFVNYTNLNAGRYVFKVLAAGRHGQWNEVGKKVRVSVASPPWRTWWAYCLYAGALAALLYSFYRRQQKKIADLKIQNRLEEVERNLALTGAVQTGFLPENSSYKSEGLTIEGFYRPADEAGGDWWWHEANDTNSMVVVGDVTGHGPGPAMITAAAATVFRSRSPKEDLDTTVRRMNDEVLRVGRGKYMMTLSLLRVRNEDGYFEYFSAAGLPLLHTTPGSKRAKAVPCTGTTLGTADFKLGRVEGQLGHGDRLLVFTDGIPEIEVKNKQIGMRGFAKMFSATSNLELGQALNRLVMQADELRGQDLQDDDWTLAAVERPLA